MSDDDYARAQDLTRVYFDWLDLDLGFQDIAAEMRDFNVRYGPPHGLFLLAREAGEVAGGVGLRRLDDGICEMKRLFVHDRFQGRGLGRRLCTELLAYAKRLGYRQMRLDTLVRMQAAVRLYRDLGFYNIAPYCANPEVDALFMQVDLSP